MSYFDLRLVSDPQGFKLQPANITSVTLKYKDENGKWVIVTNGMENVPANTDMRIEVKYHVNKSEIIDNKIVYQGIPGWMNPNSTGAIYDRDNNVVATLEVGNGNAVITFTDAYLAKLEANATIDGTFSVEGDADWRAINDPANPDPFPDIVFNFKFENDLSAKYGNYKVEKHNKELVEVRENGETGKITNTYLKYELKVKSLESDKSIPEICITDVLSTDNRVTLSNVIAGNGYVGVTGYLGSNKDGFNPYETVTGVSEYTNGTIVLGNKNLKWNINELQPGEERTLVYYVELNEKYVGSGSAGTLHNEATPESGGIKREPARDDFTPKADVNIAKNQGTIDVKPSGSGTIDYTVTVSANQNNSYTITDAFIKDSFGSGMGKYVVADQAVRVTITKGSTTKTETVTINSNGFDVPIDELKPGESVTITYSLAVQHLYSYNNGDVSLSNNASFVGDSTSGKIKNGYVFKGHGVTTWIKHNQWMRKMNGQTVNTATDISFGGNDAVYNYGNNTPQSGITGFTVPQNAQEYTVIVNEDGTWNMSGAQFNDQFNDDRIKYTGYLRIEEFDQVSDIELENDLNDGQVLTALSGQTPTNTVWVNIDGRDGFNIEPKKYGLTNASKVYRLTYYAAVDPSETNIKNIVVSNGFTVTGDIGYGAYTIHLNGVQTVVSSTLTGSASYDFDKESLFHEKKPDTSGNGEIYWVIRANGTLPKGLHIQDRPDGNSMNSNSLVGVYMGDKDYDFSNIESSEELNEALSGMDEQLKEGTNKYFYNLQSISNYADLDGHDFAIFSRGGSNSGYLTGNKKDNNKIVGVSLRPQISFDKEVETTEIVKTWHFELADGETDKFYIYYTDSSNRNHYMHISEAGSATIGDTPEQLTVSIDNNRVKIANPGITGTAGWSEGEALNWYGNNGQQIYYSGWKNKDDANNWHYLGTLDNNPRYSYKPQLITDVNDLNGKQFAIVTPGGQHSGLLVGGNSGTDALTGKVYKENFTDIFHEDIMLNSPLQKWTFEQINGTDDFYVYYEDLSGQKHYLKIVGTLATTTTDEYAIKVTCWTDGRIKLEKDGYTLNWYGGGNSGNPNYKGYETENRNNDLHYVVTEEIISADLSDFDYSWSAHDNNGSIKINKNREIPQNKSMYIVLRSHPNIALSGDLPKTFDNEVGIMDDASGQFDKLDGASYKYNPNLPLKKEGKVAVYWDGQKWDIRSYSAGEYRHTDSDLNRYFDPTDYVRQQGAGLYVEWLMNVNWDGTLDGEVILTDHLDHKMEPVLVREFNVGNSILHELYDRPEYKAIPELENDPDWEKKKTHEMPFYYNAKTGELKLAVDNLQKTNTAHEVEVNFQLICRVTDPDVIFSGTNSTLTNNADLTRPDGTFISNHEVTHIIEPTYSITKTVAGVKDNNQYASNKLTYTIEINPLAEDLIAGGDTLPVLIDEMSSNMELIGTVDVYKDSVSENTKLKKIKYSTVSNADNKQIIFDNLPDKTHLIITYKTKVNVGASSDNVTKTADISNKAYWQGYNIPANPQHSESFSYSLSGSVTANAYPVVVINKVDFYDNSITLGGAEFEIRKVETNGEVNSNAIKATTDNDGKIRIEDQTLAYNTVYQLKEVVAPTDYVLDETPKYFMVVNGAHGYPDSIDSAGKMNVGEELVDVIIDYAAGQGSTDLELTIYNQKARVKVNKVFLDESGEPIDLRDDKYLDRFYGTYRFGLYDSQPANPQATPVQILSITYSETGISYTLDGKATDGPVFTKARAGDTNFIYELNEKNEPITSGNNAYLNGYSFDVEYLNNIVVAPQKNDLNNLKVVKITNKYHPIYMPMAGGIGLKNYYKTAFFALMILFTLIAVTVKVRRKRE